MGVYGYVSSNHWETSRNSSLPYTDKYVLVCDSCTRGLSPTVPVNVTPSGTPLDLVGGHSKE